ncbi:MAG: hypothetical protein Q9228_005111 [Teloschistes exilis]
MCAYMYTLSEVSGAVDQTSLKAQTAVKTLFAFLHLYSKTPEIENLAFKVPYGRENELPPARLSRTTPIAVTTHHVQLPRLSCRDPPNYEKEPMLTLASRTSLEELRIQKSEKAAGTAFFERRPKVDGVSLEPEAESHVTIRRWRLASAAIQQYPVLLEQHLTYTHDHKSCYHLKPEELVALKVQNWPWDDLLRDVGGLVVGLVLWLANFGYGAIHAAAWNDHFPSTTEKWLWRASSAYIGFCGGLWVVLNYTAKAYRPLNEFWERWMDGGGRRWQNFLLGIPVCICGFSLLFARGFIVLEAFLSIRSLPAAAYDTPNWAQLFPHF